MTRATLSRLLSPHAFGQALADAGVIESIHTVHRIVIDVDVDKPTVQLHISRHGDERLLQVVQTLEGVEIREVARQAGGEPASTEEDKG